MEFIDHTGHIFSLADYSQYPTGFEYSEHPYVFWFSDEYNSSLSINCFYIKPIYILVESKSFNSCSIEISNSNHFKLLSSKTVQEKLSKIYDSSGNIDWTKTEMELDFFTDEALSLISNNSPNIKSEYNMPKSDFSMNIEINKTDAIDAIHETYYFINDSGNVININDETLIYNDNDTGIIFQDDTEFDENDFLSDFGYVYANNDGELVSEDDWKTYDEIDKIKFKQRNLAKRELEYKMIPFYVLANVSETGSWLTNILITVYKDGEYVYCPITVGGTFIDEQEELVINGKNMGIDLPKDICRALYNSSFWNEIPNMSLWNQKIKEYLLNYMKLRGERGNFQSAIQALKWFGWGNRITLSALIQTDNQVIDQYILDNFDLSFDVINEFRYFRYSTLLSLSIPGIVEDPSGKCDKFTWDEDFWGEGKPKLHDKFKESSEPKRYDERDIEFLRPYYEWTFNEIGLKLCALKYYYKKYFLPIHLSIHRASITNQCFANDVKMLNIATNLITEQTFFAKDDKFYVKFPDSNIIWYTDVTNYNFTVDPDTWIYDPNIGDTEKFSKIYYKLSDNCFSGDIEFIIKNFEDGEEHIFYCNMFVYKESDLLYKSTFTIFSDKESYKIKFVIYPKYFNEKFDMNFWLDKDYHIELNVNGVWYSYYFNIKVPELDIEIGKLEYKYEYDVVKQFKGWDGNIPLFNSNMYIPDVVQINNLNFTAELCEYLNRNDFIFNDKQILDGEIYYYTLLEDGSRKILTTGLKTLVIKDNKAYIVPNNNYLGDDTKWEEIETIEPVKNIYSSKHRNITSLIDLYSINLQIPKNNNLLNKVHIFNLLKKEYVYENGERVNYKFNKVKYIPANYGKNPNIAENVKIYDYKFGFENKIGDNKTWEEKYRAPSEYLEISYDNKEFTDNDSENVKELYSYIFDENGDWTKQLEYFDKDDTKEWINETQLKRYYDIYLMHDFDYWYVIMISKSTIKDNEDFYKIYNNLYRIGFAGDYDNEYYIEYLRSDEKMLINRLNWSRMNGIYHFKTSDVIAARLVNFKNLPSRLKIGSRWTFTPIALNSNYEKHFNSPTNVGIMSIGEGVTKAPRGYYRVSVNYSIDNFVNESQSRTTKILIDDGLESIGYPEETAIKEEIVVIKPNPIPDIKEKLTPIIRFYLSQENKDGSTNINEYPYETFVNMKLNLSSYKTVNFFITVNEFENPGLDFDIQYHMGNYSKTYSKTLKNKGFTFWIDSSNTKFDKIPGNNNLYKLKFKILESKLFYESDWYEIEIENTII